MKTINAKPIQDLLKPKTTKTKLFGVWVDKELLEAVQRQRRADGISLRNLMEACLKQYLLESAKEKSK